MNRFATEESVHFIPENIQRPRQLFGTTLKFPGRPYRKRISNNPNGRFQLVLVCTFARMDAGLRPFGHHRKETCI